MKAFLLDVLCGAATVLALVLVCCLCGLLAWGADLIVGMP